MTRFAVWAPDARIGVQLLVEGGSPVAMNAEPGGWYALEIPEEPAAAGVEYRFVVDGSEPLADPRSAWQPAGIDGPSRVLDPGTLVWTDGDWRGVTMPWLSGGAVYELHIGTFSPGGTFEGTIERLDQLVELGVRAVEIMPVAEFSGDHGWGYDGVFLFAPHHAYGGPHGLNALVDACHARGLGVILDVVYNHLGPKGNVLGQFGPYFTDRYATPWGTAVNLDGPGSDEVRRFFIDNACMWLADYHIDGLRIDAIHAFVDLSATHFLAELAEAVAELSGTLSRQLVLIAESDLNDPRVVRLPAAGGFGLDGVWSEDFHHSLHAALTGERTGYYQDFGSLGDVAACLQRAAVYDGRYSVFRRRRHGAPAGDLPGRRFVGFSQNHDQVGNRALGERSAALMSLGRLKIAAALVLTAPFVPMLFQGEEWAASTPFLYFTDHADPELGRAVTEGRRREFAAFGWEPGQIPDPQDPATFERSKLIWAEREDPVHAEVLAWYRALLALRRRHADLRRDRLGEVVVTHDEAAGWLRVARGSLEVVVNLAPAQQRFEVAGELVAASEPGVTLGGGALALPPDSVALIQRGNGHADQP
ncbi:MAG TPA: malto-oligosyltrehalose trehalohydrolase [Actinomycetota bacterium]|nr:malto-oligosyltrehalose trehalohydrolase [Actinomycetota bacterium]